MGEILFFTAAFLLAISILVAVHEFGHFWVARQLGVKVLRFSIGFGKPLFKWTGKKDQTEYVISALPLGGYVSMLGESEDNVSESEKHRAFRQQKLWKRSAIVAAGPAFNFLFAILAYWVMFGVGINGVKPIVGAVTPGTPAAIAGLQTNDEIIRINGAETPIWDAAFNEILPVLIDKSELKVSVIDEQGEELDKVIDISQVEMELEPDNLFKILGFEPWRPVIEPLVGRVIENSPASNAGFQEGDRILKVDGQPVNDWNELVKSISSKPESTVKIELDRNNEVIETIIIPELVVVNDIERGRIGIGPKSVSLPDDMRKEYSYPFFAAMNKAVHETVQTSWLTLKMLGKLVTGQVSVKNLSGPINIAVHAGYSVNAGFARFLKFLAIVSISLGILNLLPIPILDGGQLLFQLVEAIKGSPVSESTETMARVIGVVLLVMLMSIAFYNDLVRLFG